MHINHPIEINFDSQDFSSNVKQELDLDGPVIKRELIFETQLSIEAPKENIPEFKPF